MSFNDTAPFYLFYSGFQIIIYRSVKVIKKFFLIFSLVRDQGLDSHNLTVKNPVFFWKLNTSYISFIWNCIIHMNHLSFILGLAAQIHSEQNNIILYGNPFCLLTLYIKKLFCIEPIVKLYTFYLIMPFNAQKKNATGDRLSDHPRRFSVILMFNLLLFQI